MKKSALLAVMFLAAISFYHAAFSDEIRVAPLPESEAVFDGFALTVNGQPVPVNACRVSANPINQVWPGYQRPIEQTELAGYAAWEMNGAAKVEIVSKREIKNVMIRPQSLGIKPTVEGNKIAFEIPRIVPVVVEVNDYHGALHLLPSKMFTPPADKNAPGLHYFGPGVHDIGVLKLNANESVYLDAGAYVYGCVMAESASNIRVEGPGVIDTSRLERFVRRHHQKGGAVNAGCLRFEHCKNVTVDGPVLRDPNVWTVNVFDCDDSTFKNLRLIGLWRYNADGIDVCNCRNILVEDCFLRTFDDACVVKGIPAFPDKPNQNITFRRCVVWCDWGRALEVGAETCTPEDANIRFEDCDVIRTTGIAMDVQHWDEAAVHDITFENIRAEFDDWIPREKMQQEKGELYQVNPDDKYSSGLMTIVMPTAKSPWRPNDKRNGTVRNVVFRNIMIYANRMPPSWFKGADAEHNVDGVLIENVRFVGKEPVKDAKSLNLSIGKFVENVTIR